MPTLDPRIDAYFDKVPDFARPIVDKARRAFHRGCPGLVETIKWSRPHFEFHGLLGSVAAFKAHVAITLWHGREIDDPEGLFERVGKTEMCALKVASLAELPTQKVLTDYVRRAAAHNIAKPNAATPSAKRKTSPKRPAPKAPADLQAALAEDKRARAFFEGLAPGQQREYVEWITEAKHEATRSKRLATTIEWLGEGKRRNWKYESC